MVPVTTKQWTELHWPKKNHHPVDPWIFGLSCWAIEIFWSVTRTSGLFLWAELRSFSGTEIVPGGLLGDSPTKMVGNWEGNDGWFLVHFTSYWYICSSMENDWKLAWDIFFFKQDNWLLTGGFHNYQGMSCPKCNDAFLTIYLLVPLGYYWNDSSITNHLPYQTIYCHY